MSFSRRQQVSDGFLQSNIKTEANNLDDIFLNLPWHILFMDYGEKKKEQQKRWYVNVYSTRHTV